MLALLTEADMIASLTSLAGHGSPERHVAVAVMAIGMANRMSNLKISSISA